MQQDDIVKAFGVIRKRAWRILESDAPQVLSEAEERMKLAKSQHDTRIIRSDLQAEPWGYSIEPARPHKTLNEFTNRIDSKLNRQR